MGVPAERIVLRDGSVDPSGTRVLATSSSWADAEYYAELLGTGKQQVEQLPWVDGRPVAIELVLGGDAFAMTPMGAAHARELPPFVPVPAPAPDAAVVPEEP
jgi:hypothetical protein